MWNTHCILKLALLSHAQLILCTDIFDSLTNSEVTCICSNDIDQFVDFFFRNYS